MDQPPATGRSAGQKKQGRESDGGHPALNPRKALHALSIQPCGYGDPSYKSPKRK